MTNKTVTRIIAAISFSVLAGGLCAKGVRASAGAEQPQERPNVVLIVCDDLNDFVTGYGGHPQARTPHMQRLAGSGVAFHRAYSNNPVCAPSRSSFLTGIYPHTSGNLFWDKWFENPVLKNSKTIMEHFRDNGYHVAGSGKLMHHGRPDVWSEFQHAADYGPLVYDGQQRVAHPSVPLPYRNIGPIDGSFAPLSDVPYADDDNPTSGWIYGKWGKTAPFRYVSETDRDLTPDERNAQWAAEKIHEFSQRTDRPPLFLGVGFIRPHTPLHVPQKYFDQFPLSRVQLPVIRAGDAADTHYWKLVPEDQKGLRYFREIGRSYGSTEAGLKAFCQAYLACISAVDDCIGQVVDAVDNSALRDNTIIVVTSDHGWNMGQKDYLFKNAPWEESTRVPLIIRAPGIAQPGGIAQHPVSLIDLYPTLVDLCGLTGDTRKNEQGAALDGHSLRPFLTDPENGRWDGPDAALSMVFVGGYAAQRGLTREEIWDVQNQHWSVRTRDWRYIRYQDGSEELYDHRQDPYEWTNLADDPQFAARKKQLEEQLESMLLAKNAATGEAYWPGWLGPRRNGRVSGFRPPTPWPGQLRRLWQVEVGTGYASPLVDGGKVYQHARQGEEEVVWCLDLESGKTLWRKAYSVPFQMGGGAERHGKGPKSSPAFADGRLFTMSITGVLSAWDTDTGDLLWRRDYTNEFGKGHPYWGAATSPLVEGDRVVVHFGGDEQGALIALNVRTGEEVWRQGVDGASYSSPLVADVEGVRQIIEWNHRALVGVDSQTGRKLWEYPFPHTGSNQNMPTPVFHAGRVLLGGENRGICSVDPQLHDGSWSAEQRWHQDQVALDMSTAVMNDGLLYGFSHYDKGRFFCLDPESGEILWQGPPRTGDNVMFLSIPGYIVALINDGQLRIIAARRDRFENVASYRVSESSTYAPPVLLAGSILIKDDRTLARWSLSGRSGTASGRR